ncbi:protein translocase subunit SecE [Elysia marginata]|uniref:Protein translocase subunit SecE n=1 Tax=Elysia marginata TaxID=1093978 RepID=A0AAV4HEN6_9GAST|nr:protein translocase subunit SecE [Elysia marginata]
MSGKADVESLNRFDGLKWVVVALLVVVGVGGNYYFSAESLLYRVIGLVVLGVVAAVVAFQTDKGRVFWELLKDAKAEVRKVVWPTRQETVQTTLVVVAVVLVMGLVLWGLDSLLGWLVSSLIG